MSVDRGLLRAAARHRDRLRARGPATRLVEGRDRAHQRLARDQAGVACRPWSASRSTRRSLRSRTPASPPALRVFENADRPENTVIAQDPAGGSLQRPGTTIVLTVSRGPAQVPVPDVEGLDLATARATLRAEGFRVSVVRADTDLDRGGRRSSSRSRRPEASTRTRSPRSPSPWAASSSRRPRRRSRPRRPRRRRPTKKGCRSREARRHSHGRPLERARHLARLRPVGGRPPSTRIGTTSSPSRSARTAAGPSERAAGRRSRQARRPRRCPSPPPAAPSRRRSRASRSCCRSSTARSARTERLRAFFSWRALP